MAESYTLHIKLRWWVTPSLWFIRTLIALGLPYDEAATQKFAERIVAAGTRVEAGRGGARGPWLRRG